MTQRRFRSLITAGALALSGFAVAASPAYAQASSGHLKARTVFTQGETSGLRILAPDGTTARTVRFPRGGVSALVSPDGRRVAYTTFTQLRVMNIDGSRDRLLVPKLRARPLAWSPDSHRLIFTDGRLNMVTLSTGTVEKVQKLDNNVSSVAFSPDGRYLLVAGSSGWALLRTAGWTQRTFLPAPCPSAGGLTWSPDGQHLAMTCIRGDRRSVGDLVPVVVLTIANHHRTVLPEKFAGVPFWLTNTTLLVSRYQASGYAQDLIACTLTGKHLWTQHVATKYLTLQANR